MSDTKTPEILRSATPAEMILAAVNANTDLDKLKGLLELQKEWERNEAYKAFNRAMAEFKTVAININKDKTVSFDTAKGKTSYTHATLGNVVAITTPELGKYGLAATWKPRQENDRIFVTCRITHSQGHFEDTTLSAKADTSGTKNEIQAMGSTITYLERYTYLAALGLATADQDDDGGATTQSPKCITVWEVEEIEKALKEKGQAIAPLLKYLGVEKIEDIKAGDLQKAMNAIKAAPTKDVS